MILRALLTAASLTVASTAVLIIDCSTETVDFFGDDPLQVCSAMGSVGLDDGLVIGLGLLLFAILSGIATWVPAARPGAKRRRLEPANSLLHNLERISDFGTQLSEVDEESASIEIQLARLNRKLEAVELAVSSNMTPSREVTQQWMGLLRDANDLHNNNILATEDFKVINTRLITLFSVPKSGATDELPGAASG